MVAAGVANVKVLFQFPMKQHLLASGAFVPEIVRNVIAPDEGPDLGSNKFREPAHENLLLRIIRRPDVKRCARHPTGHV